MRYSLRIQWSPEDESFVATCPEFPGLSAFGETYEEAGREARDAMAGMIEVLQEDGEALPEAQEVQDYSGQLRLRLPKSLHRSLAEAAVREGVSLNTHIVTLLSARNAAKNGRFKPDQNPSKSSAQAAHG
jgi:predicted RNase H-like HicB family nuclease